MLDWTSNKKLPRIDSSIYMIGWYYLWFHIKEPILLQTKFLLNLYHRSCKYVYFDSILTYVWHLYFFYKYNIDRKLIKTTILEHVKLYSPLTVDLYRETDTWKYKRDHKIQNNLLLLKAFQSIRSTCMMDWFWVWSHRKTCGAHMEYMCVSVY